MFKKKLLEEMSWTELEVALADTDTAIIPMGSVEVEGPHLPLNVDSVVALEVARRVADNTLGTIIAPLLNVTYSDWHMGFPGTLTLTLPTLIKVVEELCQSLHKHGFRRIFFVNSHIGNDPAIWSMANKASVEGTMRIGMANLWPLSTEIGTEMDELEENRFLHAGEIMTSVVMAIRPDLVNMDKKVVEYLKPMTDGYSAVLSSKAKVDGKMINFYHTSNELTKSGVMGNPTAATAEKGKVILEKMVEHTSRAVDEFRKIPLPKGV